MTEEEFVRFIQGMRAIVAEDDPLRKIDLARQLAELPSLPALLSATERRLQIGDVRCRPEEIHQG